MDITEETEETEVEGICHMLLDGSSSIEIVFLLAGLFQMTTISISSNASTYCRVNFQQYLLIETAVQSD